MVDEKEAVLGGGTMAAFELDPTNAAGVYTVVDGVLSFGATGEKSEAKDQSTLADTTARYGTGFADTPDKTIKSQHYPNNLTQEAFIDQAVARVKMGMIIIWPSGRQASNDLALLGFEMDEGTNADWETFTVAAKQSGATVWIKPSDVTPPTAFPFTPKTGETVSTQVQSDPIVVAGLGTGVSATLSVLNGKHLINGAAAAQTVVTVKDGDSIVIEVTASAAATTEVKAIVNIGGVIQEFSVTTAP